MLQPKVKFHFNVILVLLSIFFITHASFSEAKDKYFQTWHTDNAGKSEVTHKGKITTSPHENTVSTQINIQSEPVVDSNPIVYTPVENQVDSPNHVDITFSENSIPNALLLDDFLSTEPNVDQITSQLESHPVILVNMPSVALEHLQNPLEPIFQVTGVSNEDGQITIHAQPQSCINCSCQHCPDSEGAEGVYCADCSCCTHSGCPSEGDKCSGCSCDACPPKEGATNSGDCASCLCCQNKCQGSKRSAVIIKLSSGNGSISSVHLHTPSGTVTVMLSENTFPSTATAPDNIAATIALFATLVVNTAASKSAK